MSAWRRAARIATAVVGGLVLLLVATALAIIAWAEWQARSTAPGTVPAQFRVEGPAVGSTAAGATAPVLILLHGAGLNGHMWDAVRRQLDPRERRIGEGHHDLAVVSADEDRPESGAVHHLESRAGGSAARAV